MIDLKRAASDGIYLMDLTTLNLDDNDIVIEQLCHKAVSPEGKTAAVCIYPKFIPVAKKTLADIDASDVLVATVVNFPHGNDDVVLAVKETEQAVSLGADEVDVVFPYRAFLAGNLDIGRELVKRCKAACGDDVCLKVILETGEIKQPQLIKQASLIAIEAGADFIKTSTGKVPVNATLEAAEQMLMAIAETESNCGFKASGGVKNAQDVADYLALTSRILSRDWINRNNFRFGASSLLDNLLHTLGATGHTVTSEGY